MSQTTINQPDLDSLKDDPKYFTYHDIVAAIKNRGMGLPLDKTYDPETFWNGLGDEYYKRFRKKEQFMVNAHWIIDIVNVLGAVSLLEPGCGFGRLLPILLENCPTLKKADGFDIADNILRCSAEYLKPMEPTEENPNPPNFEDVINLKKGDIRKMTDYESNSYDVVVSSETIQHLSPRDAESAIREMVRVAKRAVVLIERWGFPGEHAEPHMWTHNYAEFLSQLGTRIAKSVSIGQNMHLVVALKHAGP